MPEARRKAERRGITLKGKGQGRSKEEKRGEKGGEVLEERGEGVPCCSVLLQAVFPCVGCVPMRTLLRVLRLLRAHGVVYRCDETNKTIKHSHHLTKHIDVHLSFTRSIVCASSVPRPSPSSPSPSSIIKKTTPQCTPFKLSLIISVRFIHITTQNKQEKSMKTETEFALQAFIGLVTNIAVFPVASHMLRRKMVSYPLPSTSLHLTPQLHSPPHYPSCTKQKENMKEKQY